MMERGKEAILEVLDEENGFKGTPLPVELMVLRSQKEEILD